MFKKLALGLFILSGVLLNAQGITTSAQTTQTTFDTVYWAAQPPAVQACRSTCTQSQATTLAAEGYSIDVPVDVWGWDAYLVMTLREQFGYTWVPALGQAPVACVPNLVCPGIPAYNPNTAPMGSIKVSTNPADFPAYVDPIPPGSTVAPASFVGPLNFGCVYVSLPGDPNANGAQVTIAGSVYTLTKIATPFGTEQWYTLNGCQ